MCMNDLQNFIIIIISIILDSFFIYLSIFTISFHVFNISVSIFKSTHKIGYRNSPWMLMTENQFVQIQWVCNLIQLESK